VWSYRELATAVDRSAAFLAAQGVCKGDRVAIASTPRPEVIVTLLACMRLGAIWVGLNPKYKTSELAHLLEDSAPCLVVSILSHPDGDPVAERVAEAARALSAPPHLFRIDAGKEFADDWASALAVCDTPPPADCVRGPRDPAVLVYTSGSTGAPKGAMLPHEAFTHCGRVLATADVACTGVFNEPIMICNLPINHVGGLTDTVGTVLMAGGTVILQDRFEAHQIGPLVRQHEATLLCGVPLMLQAIFASESFDPADFASLKAVGWGGAALPAPVLDAYADLGVQLFTTYGLTEGGSISTVTRIGDDRTRLLETVGAVTDDQELRVVDVQGQPVASGEEGEIQIRGIGIMLGYFNDPAATAAAFTDDGWLRSGDIGSFSRDGWLSLSGRMSEMFKSGGYNVYPREIEAVLEDHPTVFAAAVVGAPHPDFSEAGVAFIVPAAGEIDPESLSVHCRERLANYKTPKAFVRLDDPPRLPIGKIDKKALKNRAADFFMRQS
jgi:acyl-CoA synthetase (AMP-forming)/AMP-acid ligase II